MTFRRPLRFALAVLLLCAQLLPAFAPLASAASKVFAFGSSAPASMPCDPAAPRSERRSDAPCNGCCPHATCDASACVATGCLPSIFRLATLPTRFASPLSMASGRAPALLGESPLRPPIA